MEVDLEDLGFDRGAGLLLKRALRSAADGQPVTVTATAPDFFLHLRAWCRAEGHELRELASTRAVLIKDASSERRWAGAERAGRADPQAIGAVLNHPPQRWGLAARGALVEAGSLDFHFPLANKVTVWTGNAGRIYAQAVAAQWDPATAIPWSAAFTLPADVEDAVVQLMTYLIENEMAALIVPSRFIAQLHPHFHEVMQVLAVQAADEARHIEVFRRRALLKRRDLGLSTTGGQASLQTLLNEPDFAIASFLLSVLGEGTFLSLLWFLEHYAPDPVTAAVCRLAAQDEARHVAFGMSHLREHILSDPTLRGRLANAVRSRHDALQHTAGLNAEVFDALVLMAAGSWDIADIAKGHGRVMALTQDMHKSRTKRLLQLGFSEEEAEDLSALHTRNFM